MFIVVAALQSVISHVPLKDVKNISHLFSKAVWAGHAQEDLFIVQAGE